MPIVETLTFLQSALAVPDLAAEVAQFAQRIAQALQDTHPLVVAGYNCGSESIVRASANVAWALRKRGFPAQLAYTVPDCNSMGTALMEGGADLLLGGGRIEVEERLDVPAHRAHPLRRAAGRGPTWLGDPTVGRPDRGARGTHPIFLALAVGIGVSTDTRVPLRRIHHRRRRR